MLPLYDNIRRRRIELGMSQQELAEKAGYTDRSSIAKIESGKVDLTQSKIVSIAKALNISPGMLMGWTLPELKAMWRYATIENEKIVLKFPGLSNSIKISELSEQNSPLPFDISPHLTISEETIILSEHKKEHIAAHRNKPEIQNHLIFTPDSSALNQNFLAFNMNGKAGAHEVAEPSVEIINEINKLGNILRLCPLEQITALLKIVEQGGNIPLNAELPKELGELLKAASRLKPEQIKTLIQVAENMN